MAEANTVIQIAPKCILYGGTFQILSVLASTAFYAFESLSCEKKGRFRRVSPCAPEATGTSFTNIQSSIYDLKIPDETFESDIRLKSLVRKRIAISSRGNPL